MSVIKIFMCCHKQYEILPPACIPIQCGSVLNVPVEGALSDAQNENISDRNREYCELTAHYYAWKNEAADYYGFCHYRRFFYNDESHALPYIAVGKIRGNPFPDEAQWQNLTAKYDVIVPRSENMGLSARDHYCSAPFHYTEDLNLFLAILAEKSPEFMEPARKYLSQNCQYFCNMFVMRQKYFFEYCKTLFPVLEEFDKRKMLHGDFQSDRTDGYLGEIFTGIYINYLAKRGVKIKTLPRMDIKCPMTKRILYVLFPPESKRRFWAKKLFR